MMKKNKNWCCCSDGSICNDDRTAYDPMAAGIWSDTDLRREQCEPLRNRAWQLLWPERWKLPDRKQLQTRKVPE